MSLIIRRKEEKDHRAVEELTREAFWNVYHPGALLSTSLCINYGTKNTS